MRSQVANSAVEWIEIVTPGFIPARPARPDSASPVRIAWESVGAVGGPGRGERARPASHGTQAPQPAAGEPAGPILVVDDDQSILATIHEILELEGYPVVAVSDAAEALRRAVEVRPSLLLLDMRMPGMTGWELAAELRSRGIAVPILVMTAARDAQLWAEQIGAAGFLPKPFDLDDLLAAVERLWSS